jgi:putative peptide zinc metalloprotease protein
LSQKELISNESPTDFCVIKGIKMNPYQVCQDIYIVENENAVPGKEFFISQGVRNFYVSTVIAELLQSLKDGKSIPAVISHMTNSHKIKEEQIQFLLDKKLPELGLISHSKTIEKKPDQFEQYIKFAVPVLTEGFVVASSSKLKYLYQPFLAFISLALAAVAFGMLFTSEHFSALSWNAVVAFPMIFTPEEYIWLYVTLIASYLLHELGHTSAGARYGVGIDKIGVGIYLIFPVFYSDMSKVWSLSIPKRVTVNIGGSYFQFLFAGCIALYAAMTGSLVAVFAIYIIMNSTILNLSPFLRFDGYWIYSDLFNIPNLRHSSRKMMGSLLINKGQTFSQRAKHCKQESPALFYYAIGSQLFLIFICYVLMSIGIELVYSAPEVVETLISQFIVSNTFAEYSMTSARAGYFLILGIAYCLLLQRMVKGLTGLVSSISEAK